MSGDAVIAVHEERARIGNVDIARNTALIATDEGIVAVEINTIEERPLPQRYPAVGGSRNPPAVTYNEPEKGCSDYCCCECDSQYSWYDLQGKGCFMEMMLILLYFILIVVSFPLLLLFACCYIFCMRPLGLCQNVDAD